MGTYLLISIFTILYNFILISFPYLSTMSCHFVTFVRLDLLHVPLYIFTPLYLYIYIYVFISLFGTCFYVFTPLCVFIFIYIYSYLYLYIHLCVSVCPLCHTKCVFVLCVTRNVCLSFFHTMVCFVTLWLFHSHFWLSILFSSLEPKSTTHSW